MGFAQVLVDDRADTSEIIGTDIVAKATRYVIVLTVPCFVTQSMHGKYLIDAGAP